MLRRLIPLLVPSAPAAQSPADKSQPRTMKFTVAVAMLTITLGISAHAQQSAAKLDAPTAGRFAALALACVQKEYPNKIAHVLNSPEDVKAPRALTPAFYGCYDWHSSVHGHWMLARLVREFPSAPFATEAAAALEANLTPAHIAGEVAYLKATGRESFERPYGLAWLLQLSAELRETQTPEAASLSAAVKPLEAAVVAQIKAWLPKLVYPIREGEHAQTAFAFGLILDYSRGTDPALAAMVTAKVNEFYRKDRDCPINYEPSGQDFLSPCIAEADVMRRVLTPAEFAVWLTKFLPRIPTDNSGKWLPVGIVLDKTDGKLAHLDGLNLSRAWMLEGIAARLPSGDRRIRALMAAAGTHAASGLTAVTGEHYAGGHWLGSFATYLTTRRGVGSSAGTLLPANSSHVGVSAAVRPSLIGVWRVLQFCNVDSAGVETNPLGEAPNGVFVYTPTGQLSLHAMRTPPIPPFAAGDDSPTDAERRTMLDGYFGYFGTYTITSDSTVIHHVAGGTIPSYAGTEQRRQYRIRVGGLNAPDTLSIGGNRLALRCRKLIRVG